MNTLQKPMPDTTNVVQKSSLLDMISQWPDWKIQALCLDESDLRIREAIQTRRAERTHC